MVQRSLDEMVHSHVNVFVCVKYAYSKNGEMPLDIAIELTSNLQYLINTWLVQVR